jgi:hypothetical protein
MSCAQTAIIPTNSVIDAKAAASSTNILNIARLPVQEHMRNIVPFLFSESSVAGGSVWKKTPKEIPWLMEATKRHRRSVSDLFAALSAASPGAVGKAGVSRFCGLPFAMSMIDLASWLGP